MGNVRTFWVIGIFVLATAGLTGASAMGMPGDLEPQTVEPSSPSDVPVPTPKQSGVLSNLSGVHNANSADASLTVDVRMGDEQASEVNALLIYQDRDWSKPYRKIENYPSVDLKHTLSDLPAGHEYFVSAYIQDQQAGNTGWFEIGAGESITKEIDALTRERLSVRAFYDDGSTPLEGAQMTIESHESYQWRSGTTGENGYARTTKGGEDFYLYPPGEDGAYYTVKIHHDDEVVASQRVDSLTTHRTLGLTTSVEGSVEGTITRYHSPSSGQDYELDKWYDVTIEVRNDGATRQTFTVRPEVPTGTETRADSKSLTLDSGATGTVTFEQQWYGAYTNSRSFSHELLADSDSDGSLEVLDEGSVTLSEPPNGELHLAPNTGDGEPATLDVRATNTGTGETEIDRPISTDGTDVSAKIISVPAGTYDVTVGGDGYRSKTVTVTVEAGTERVVEPLLTPSGVDASIDDIPTVQPGTYNTGDIVKATVDVTNTGEKPWEFFVGYSVRHGESGETYSNEGKTGKFVTLDSGQTKTVTVEWRVDDGAKGGVYDAITSVWYGYPEDGADKIESSGWSTDAFEVATTPTSQIQYQGSNYRIEQRSDDTIAVYDTSGSLVGADTAKQVLRYKSFRNHSGNNVTGGRWSKTDQAAQFEKYYWLSHLNQAGITGFKAYVNSHFGSYKDSLGDFVDLSVQASRALNQQRSGSTYQWIHNYSKETQRAYGMYDQQKTDVERLKKTAEVVKKAYRLKRKSNNIDTISDAVKQASDATDAGDTIQGIAIETAMLPLNDVGAGLKITEKQSLMVYQWGKTSKPVLQMLDNLEQKRRAGTITRDEMKLFYYLQIRFYGSQTNMLRQMATLQKKGKQSSVAFSLITSLNGQSPETYQRQAAGMQTLVNAKIKQMGVYLNHSENLINRSVNIYDDPVRTRLDRREPLLVQPSPWVPPGEKATIHVLSRGQPVINAKVTVGDKVIETDTDGNATVTFYEPGTYDITISKDGFKSAHAALLVRDKKVSTQGFEPISLGAISKGTTVTKTTEMTNSGDISATATGASIDHEGLSASVVDGQADPGESIVVSVTADSTALEPGSSTDTISIEWDGVSDTSSIPVNWTVVGGENLAPIAEAGSDQSVAAGEKITLDASGSSDPNGDSLTYMWEQTDTPAVVLEDVGTSAVRFAAPSVDSITKLTFEVTVDDGNGETATDTVNVTISPTDAAGDQAFSFESADNGVTQPPEPWHIINDPGEAKLSTERASDGTTSLRVGSYRDDLSETRVGINVTLDTVETITVDSYIKSSNLYWGYLTVHLDDNNRLIRLDNKAAGKWYYNLTADVSDISGEHTLVLRAVGDGNDAYFDNIRFLDATGETISPKEVTDDMTNTGDQKQLSATHGVAVNQQDGVGYVIENSTIVKFDIDSRDRLDSFPAPDGTDKGLAYGARSLWYADAATDAFDGRIVELDPNTGEMRSEINTGYDPYGLAFGDGSLWAGEVTGVPNNVYEFSPDGTQIGSFDIGGPAGSTGPNGLAHYNDSVWVGTNTALFELGPNGGVIQEIAEHNAGYKGLAGTSSALYGPDAEGNLTTIRGHQQNKFPGQTQLVSAFTYAPPEPIVNEQIKFNATNSSTTNGTITTYKWDFDGDGTIDSTTHEPTVMHSYMEPGQYAVKLTVVDEYENRNTTTRPIRLFESENMTTGLQTSRSLGSTVVGQAESTTMTVTANTTNTSLTISDEFNRSVESATVQSVKVNGTTANPIIEQANQNGVVVTLDNLQPGATVTISYKLSVGSDPVIGTSYRINGTVVSGEVKTTSTRTLTVVEQGPVGRFDTDGDGIEVSELGSAAAAFARGDLSIGDLGQVATAFTLS